MEQSIAARSGEGGNEVSEESSVPLEPFEPPETLDATEAVDDGDPAAVESDMDYEDDDYESGKEAAEARTETGFISRLFRPRRN